MRRYSKFIALTAGTILLIVSSGMVVNAQLGPFRPPSSLLSASPEDVAQAAKEYTASNFKIVSGAPAVLLTRSVTKEELPKLGLPEIDFGGETPPLMVVALKGDFDVRGLSPGATSSWRVNYIVYVFDLKAGVPALTLVSPRGGEFRILLNDPSLPDDDVSPPIDTSNTMPSQIAPATPVPVAPPVRLPYGEIAPPALDPGAVPPAEK